MNNHSQKYIEYLKSPEWNARRQSALQRADYRCEKCGERDGLEVHHKTYKHLGDEPLNELLVLCKSCHWAFDERRKWIGNKNKIGKLNKPRQKSRKQFIAEIEMRKRAAHSHTKAYAQRKEERRRKKEQGDQARSPC